MITGTEKIKDGGAEKQYDVSIDNGDLKLLDQLVDAYGFKDRDSLIKFGIAALLEGTNNEGIYTIKSTPTGRTLSKIAPPAEMLNSAKEK